MTPSEISKPAPENRATGIRPLVSVLAAIDGSTLVATVILSPPKSARVCSHGMPVSLAGPTKVLRIRSCCRTGARSSRCATPPPTSPNCRRRNPAPEWQAAISELILAVERNRPTMLARIGYMLAPNRHRVREFNPNRKDHHWGRRKVSEISKSLRTSASNPPRIRNSTGMATTACVAHRYLAPSPPPSPWDRARLYWLGANVLRALKVAASSQREAPFSGAASAITSCLDLYPWRREPDHDEEIRFLDCCCDGLGRIGLRAVRQSDHR